MAEAVVQHSHPIKGFFGGIYSRFIANASPEMKACLAAGIPIEYRLEGQGESTMLVGTTKYPVAVTTAPDGTITVYSKKPAEN